MSKIDRYTGNYKPFGANSQGTERTIFEAPGATDTQSDTLDANINADYLRGWGDNVVGPSQHPTRQQFNAGMFTLGQTLAYLHQEGIAEWDASQEYNKESLCKVGGRIFVSFSDSNIGNNPTSSGQWYERTASVNALDFGARGDGVTESSAAIISALSLHDEVVVPSGTYRCDGMITLGSGKSIRLSAGATLLRTTDTANTDPVVWVNGRGGSIIGSGQEASLIKSDNKAPKGVLLIGAWDMTGTTDDVTHNTFRDFGVSGKVNFGQTSGAPDAAILIQGPDIGGKAVYFQTISGIRVERANYGIWLKGYSNANTISDIQGQRLGDDTVNGGALFYDNGALDNAVVNAFFHQSPNGTCLKMEKFDNTSNGGVIHQTFASSYSNIVCEQSGASALGLKAIDGSVSATLVDMRVNAAGGVNIDSGFRARNSFTGPGSTTEYIKSLVATPYTMSFLNDDDTNAAIVEKGYKISGMSENSEYKVATVSIDDNSRSAIVKISVGDRWGDGINTDSSEVATFAVKRDAAGVLSWQIIDHIKMGDSSVLKGLEAPYTSAGNSFIFGYKSGNNGTSTTSQSVSVKVSVYGEVSGIVFHQALTAASASSVIRGANQKRFFDNQVLCSTDAAHSLGAASNRWSEVFAANGTINTSDEREKTALEALSVAEKNAAIEVKGSLGRFKWLSAIEKKGDGARYHFGVGAQTVGNIFTKHGLDPDKYGVFCFDEWHELDGQRVPAGTKGATKKDRYGVRYEELLSFIIAAL